MKIGLLAFLLATGIFAGVQLEQQHNIEARAAYAVRILQNNYVLTNNQSLRIVYANAWHGNVCMEYVVDDAREQSSIRYAVLEKDAKFLNYNLDQEDLEDRCSMAGVDLTDVAVKELEDRNP